MEDQILDTHLGQSEAPGPANLTYSTIGARLLALILDTLIMAAVIVVLTLLNTIDKNTYFVTAAVQFAFLLFYEVYLVQATGATLGKRALDLKIVTVDGLPVGWQEAFMRYLPTFLLGVLAQIITLSVVLNMDADYYEGLSWLERLGELGNEDSSLSSIHQTANFSWIVADIIVFFVTPNRRALHDLIAKTVVISTK
jgi:uncharacterized RDD family membrane protein YckC